MSFGPSFIGFAPEEKAKAMSTLSKVIELKDKNRAAAEESRGFEVAEEEKYATRFKPLVEAISEASSDIIRYNSESDVKFAAKEVIDAVSQVRVAAAQAAQDPANQGYAALVPAYQAQLDFAKSKMDYLNAAKKYSKDTSNAARLAALEKARDDYADTLSRFENITIPLGFKQTVSIQRPPPKGSVFPGANLEISPTPAVPVAVAPKAAPKAPPVVAPPAPGLVKKVPPPPKSKKTAAPPAPPTGKKAVAPPPVKLAWAYKLLDLRKGTDKIPTMYRHADDHTQAVPGSISIVDLSKDGVSMNIRIQDATGAKTSDGILTLSTGSLLMSFTDYNGSSISQSGDLINRKLFEFPAPIFNELDIAYMVLVHARVFGGWGVAFWGINPGDKYDFMSKIMKNKHYKAAIAKSNTIAPTITAKVPVGEGASVLKFKTKAIPKASMMKLGPDGEYGNLIIDVPALYNEGRLIARERGDQYGSNSSGGTIKLDEAATPGIKNLITKRAMQTTIDKSSPVTQKQLKRIRKLAGFIPTKGKGVKSKSNSGVIVVGDVGDILNRMKIACGVYDAGNRSKKNAQLISELASKLMELHAIDEPEYAKILEKYKA